MGTLFATIRAAWAPFAPFVTLGVNDIGSTVASCGGDGADFKLGWAEARRDLCFERSDVARVEVGPGLPGGEPSPALADQPPISRLLLR
jgi:hypothetical protein